jgi:5-methylthioadenosine/S-adenosylhomocysteine deaminase
MNDAYGSIVTGMDTSNVESVMVGGKFVKWLGALVGVNLKWLRRVDPMPDHSLRL